MRKGRFSEEQIINVLKEHQAGIPVVELCRKHGISDATFFTSAAAVCWARASASSVSRASMRACIVVKKQHAEDGLA